MASITINIPNAAVSILQSALDHYNQANNTSLTPKQAVALAIFEWAWPHAAAVQTEQINAQANSDMDAENQRVRSELEKII